MKFGKSFEIILKITTTNFPVASNPDSTYTILTQDVMEVASRNLDLSLHDGFGHFFEIAWNMFNFSINGQNNIVLDENSYDFSEVFKDTIWFC